MNDIIKLLDGNRLTITTPSGSITVIAPTRTIKKTRVKIRSLDSLESVVVSFDEVAWTVSTK